MIGYGIIRQIAVRRARTASPVISRESTTVAAQIAGANNMGHPFLTPIHAINF